MAAKKTSKKKVSIELDSEDLIALLEAARAVVAVAEAKILASDDPALRKHAKKGAKKGARKGRR